MALKQIESVAEAIETLDFMLDEASREAQFAIREHDRIATAAKRDAIREASIRLKTGKKDPRWHLAQPFYQLS